MFSGLAGRIRLAAIFLSLLPLVCGGALLILLSVNANRSEAAQLQVERAARAAKTLDAYLVKLKAAVEQISSTRSLTELSSHEQTRILEGIRKPNSAFLEATLMKPDSDTPLATDPALGGVMPPSVKAAIASARGAALAGETHFSDVYVNEDTGNPEIVLASPAYDEQGSIEGYVYFRVSLEYLKYVLDNISVGNTGYAYIVDSQGDIIARKDTPISLAHPQNVKNLPPVSAYLRTGKLPDNGSFPAKTYEGITGEQVLGSYFSFTALNWAVVVELPTNEVDAPLFQMLIVLAGAFLVTLSLVVLVALITVRWLVRPLQVLQQGAEQVSAGNYNVRIEELDTNDELDYLARTFNQMTENLESNKVALEKQIAQTDSLFRDAAERAARLEVLMEVSRAVSSTLDPDSLYSIMADQIRRVVAYDWLGLALPGEAGAMLRIAYSSTTAIEGERGGLLGYHVGASLPIGSGPDLAYRSCQPILVTDTADANALYATISMRDAGFRSFVAVPIERNREVLGVLIASSRTPNAFNDDQRDLLSAIGVQLAIALNNSRVYQRLRQAYSDLDKSLASRASTHRLS